MNICAATMVRTDRPYEVKEWVNYHKLLGVNKFYIYDDFSTVDLKPVFPDNTKWFPAKEEKKFVQFKLFEKFMKAAKEDDIDWLILTDVDEYIIITDELDLISYLQKMEKYTAIEIQMRNYSPIGCLDNYNPNVSIFDSFPLYYKSSRLVKTMLNMKHVIPLEPDNPHHYIDNAVNCIGNKPTYTYSKHIATGHLCNTNLPVWINHYPIRDIKQIHKKIKQRRCFLSGYDYEKQLDYVLRYMLSFTNPNSLDKFSIKREMPELYKKHIENCDWLFT